MRQATKTQLSLAKTNIQLYYKPGLVAFYDIESGLRISLIESECSYIYLVGGVSKRMNELREHAV